MINKNDLIDIIRLIRTPKIGVLTFVKLINDYGSATNVLEILPTILKRTKVNIKIYPKHKALEEIELAEKNNISIISYLDDFFPALLKEIEDFPPILFAKGHKKLLTKTSFAIVGSRNASILGKKNAQFFAEQLGNNGFCIVSGMAKGIDAAAHEGALSKGTIAVLGGGVDNIYPKENKKLYEKLCEQGTIISEFPIGTNPIPSNFPRRNRIISGISRGVLIVESSLNSGSLLTANMALDQGREVFAIPGSPSDIRSKGPNMLIKNGAILTEKVEDIINNLPNKTSDLKETLKNFNTMKSQQFDDKELDKIKALLIQNLNSAPISIDIVLQELKVDYNSLSTSILELELEGKLERMPGNKISLINNIE